MAILHPNIFYFVLDASWSSNSNNSIEYWNKGNASTSINNNKVYKTIYSPSPTSYVEPRTAAFTGFTTNGGYTTSISDFNVNSSFNNGWNFYCQTNHQGGTIFFSALGFRDVNSSRQGTTTSGSIGYTNICVYYWASEPALSVTNYLCFYLNYGFPHFEYYMSTGFPMRSVSE